MKLKLGSPTRGKRQKSRNIKKTERVGVGERRVVYSSGTTITSPLCVVVRDSISGKDYFKHRKVVEVVILKDRMEVRIG